MMGDSSSVQATVGGGATTTTTVDVDEGGGGRGGGADGSNSGDEEGKQNNYGGNRWPRQETLALLKIRSDMDQVFRESSVKAPLWEQVSRKLAEVGYVRSAKKCKEKFDNVYKYHKRTKEGRTGKSQPKTYRFFDQLEAFETHLHNHQRKLPPPPPLPLPSGAATTKPQTTSIAPTATLPWTNPPVVSHHVTVSFPTNPTTIPTPLLPNYSPDQQNNIDFQSSFRNISAHFFSNSTSSSTASDQELEGRSCRKGKRKWKDFFQRLAKDVIKRQEDLQKRFLEKVEKLERQRAVHEESWRIQEMARISQEHEILIQERATAVAKDAAVIAFLQKISPPPPPEAPPVPVTSSDVAKRSDLDNVNSLTSSSRWPKAEVIDLIKLRTSLDSNNYEESGGKGPLWEEVSAGMQKLGYNRSAKKCKEKWENINKYFKKMKESSKTKPQDSKTCPYFHYLDALYKEKSKNIKPISTTEPLMACPERQFEPQQENQPQNNEEEEDGDEEDAYTEEEDEGGGFEVVASKAASLGNGSNEGG